MSPTLGFSTLISSEKKQAAGVSRKIQPQLRAIQEIFLSCFFSSTESPGRIFASGIGGGSSGKGA